MLRSQRTLLLLIKAVGFVWFGTGFTILLSMYHGLNGWGINSVIGVFFLCIGRFLCRRTLHIQSLLQHLTDEKGILSDVKKRFVQSESILMTLALGLGVLLLWGALSRCFAEHSPVFG